MVECPGHYRYSPLLGYICSSVISIYDSLSISSQDWLALDMHALLKSLVLKRESSTKGSGKKKPQRCFILDLPTELLCQVDSYLPGISAACLALTCKRFYQVSGAALHADKLQSKIEFSSLFKNHATAMFENDRWQFLEMLENRRWIACSKCLTLHPRSSFSSKELNRKPIARVCRLGQLAGVVDLCPCKQLTFQGTLGLVNHLYARENLEELLKDVGGYRPQQRYLWHSCTQRYGSSALKIDLFPEVDYAERLLVRTEYHLYVEREKLGGQECITTRFGCPHQLLDVWLTDMCKTADCRTHQFGCCLPCGQMSTCGICRSELTCRKKRPYHCEQTDKEVFYFDTLRFLGTVATVPGTIGSVRKLATVPDRQWALQRAHPSPIIATTCRHPWPRADENDG